MIPEKERNLPMKTKTRLAAALAALVMIAALPLSALAANSGGRAVDVYGNPWYIGENLQNNQVIYDSSDPDTNAPYHAVAGGLSLLGETTSVSNNALIVDHSLVNAYGGYISITWDTLDLEREAVQNTLIIGSSASVQALACGGYAHSYTDIIDSSDASSNAVVINGGKMGDSSRILGGYAEGKAASASQNAVSINGGEITAPGDIVGGHAVGDHTAGADGNIVSINGGKFQGWTVVYGGRAVAGSNGRASASNNLVVLGPALKESDLATVTLYGGSAQGGLGASADGNTLQMQAGNLRVHSIENFDYYSFDCGVLSTAGPVLLLVKQDSDVKIHPQRLTFSNPDRLPPLKPGDVVPLIGGPGVYFDLQGSTDAFVLQNLVVRLEARTSSLYLRVIDDLSYTVKDSAGNETQFLTWEKSSGKSLDMTVHRSLQDHLTYDKFTTLEIDGKTVGAEHYTTGRGSLKLSLKPAYLETLSVGDHDVKVNFEDGSAAVGLTVTAQAPKTGDGSDPALWSGLALLALAGLAAVALTAKGRRKTR